MKITDKASLIGRIAKLSKTDSVSKASEAKETKGGGEINDTVSLSNQALKKAELHQKGLEIAESTPEVDEERVAAIKQAIADGTYKPNAEAIAQKILEEAAVFAHRS